METEPEQPELSLAEVLASSPSDVLEEFLAGLSELEAEALQYEWDFLGRPKQQWPAGDWTTWAIIAGRGFGKEIDVNELVPTRTGYKTMGTLEVGDVLFDRFGNETRVTELHPIRRELDCYRLTFSDGVTVVASGDHRWVTRTAVERKRLATRSRSTARAAGARGGHNRIDVYEGVRTTNELRASLRAPDGACNHSIDLAVPYDPEDVSLPLDPYTLGAWLGDGSTRDQVIHGVDEEIADRVAQALDVRELTPGRCRMWRFGSGRDLLRAAGVWQNKHIPIAYLRASRAQRLELLRGLMDTDGSVAANGYCMFGGVNERLVDDVYELLCSLGMAPRRRSRPARYVKEGQTHETGQTAYELWFSPTVNPFHLARKASRVRFDRAQSARRSRRYLKSVELVPSIAVRCITVDSPDHTFLVGRAHLVTHNSWTGAQSTRRVAESGEIPILHLIAPTPADYRDVMIEGPAGLQAISPKWSRPEFYPSKRLLVWPNGVRALCFSAEDPEALRGPQCGFIWHDEPGAWTYGEQTWDQSQFGLRIQPRPGPVLGGIPRQVMTTTPKPFKWLRAILSDPTTHLTTGSTYENINNLAEAFKRAVIKKYEGTTLGRQELFAQLLEAVQGALWTPDLLETTRVHTLEETRPRCVVAVDPAATSTEESDETGIVVACTDSRNEFYVIEDATPGRVSPAEWARAAVSAYYKHRADVIVAEVNNGGDMVLSTIRNIDPNVRLDKVTASRGKATRAEPIAALFEQNRAHLLGTFPKLEDQLTGWVPGGKDKSPDRLDAMVWALTSLSAGRRARLIA